MLALMAEGRSNQAISGRLFTAPKSVEAPVSSIFAKLGLLPASEEHEESSPCPRRARLLRR